ncbi:MAG: tyrosine-type recombinase/integrase, partial [Selenomonadaceae bacterium]|nr:tyrosine-type recombinase/integrase [Selenomonadaceae bacterium]
MITYLDKKEMDALLNLPDKQTEQGWRDYVLLLFLYNTGARAEEAATLQVKDLFIPKG